LLFGVVAALYPIRVDLRELALRIEGAGLESVFLPEHSHWPGARAPSGREDADYAGVPDPMVALSFMAAATTTLKVGTAVSLIPQHDPINLAKAVASLDRISAGRFLFGVGAGWIEAEMRDHAVDPSRRFGILWDRIDLMRKLWTGTEVPFGADANGASVIQQPLVPVQRPGPPVLAGVGRRRLPDVVTHADGWFPHASEFSASDAETYLELARAANRPKPSISLFNAQTDSRVIASYVQAGVERCVFHLDVWPPELTRNELEQYEVIRRTPDFA
jgi:probable F420-dependent oxidoreductase